MKRFYIPILAVIAGLILACAEGDTIFNTEKVEKSKLAPPLGLQAEPGNGKVLLTWFTSNYEEDFGGYFIYKAEGDFTSETNDTLLTANFEKVETIGLKAPVDKMMERTIGGLTNGKTYSFAVVAFADAGDKISYPSNIVAAVPEIKVVTSKEKLSPPLGLHSVTGNGQVSLFWYTSNYETIFQGYYIYLANGDQTAQSSDSALSASFALVDSLPVSNKSDALRNKVISGLTNGQTYSFAVVAYAYYGEQISHSSNIIKDTPRPELKSITIRSASTNQVAGDDTQAGFRFDDFTVVDVPAVGYTNDNGCDIINEAYDPSKGDNIRAWLAGMNGGGLQDLGYMDNLDGADVAPEFGYSEEGKSIAVLLGHVYAVKTGDGYYGKMIITDIGAAPYYSIKFNAAFQTQKGNRNYKMNPDVLHDLGIHP